MNEWTYEIKEREFYSGGRELYVRLHHITHSPVNFILREFREKIYYWDAALKQEIYDPKVLLVLSICRDELLERGLINE